MAAGHALRSAIGPDRNLISSMQASAVIELAKLANVSGYSAEEKAGLSDAIVAVPWADGDLSRVLNTVMFATDLGSRALPKPRAERRHSQRYMPSLLSYLTHDEWGLIGCHRISVKT